MPTAKRRLLFVITLSDWGGAQSYVLNTAKEAVRRGYEVLIAAGGRNELAKRCAQNAIPYRELLRMKRSISPFTDLPAVRELERLMREWKPDIAYLHSSKAGVVGAIAAKRANVPRVVYRIGGWSFLDPVSWFKKFLRRRTERSAAKLKDAIIVLHPDDEELAKKYRILPRGELAVIPNGIDLETFDQLGLDRVSARQQLETLWEKGLRSSTHSTTGRLHDPSASLGTGSTTLFLTVANFFPTKNLLGYLDAIAILHKNAPDVRFLIIGDGAERKALEDKRHRLGLDNIVALPGAINDASTLLRGADAFVLPSAKEGMPWALLEAMAARLPCVATDVGANAWMLNGAGWIVPPGNADALAYALLDAVRHPDDARLKGEAARREAEWRFTAKRMYEETFRLL